MSDGSSRPAPPSASSAPPNAAAIADRVARLRVWLADQDLDGFLQPRADRHQGEAVPACDERLAWISGFTGSAGFALIQTGRADLVVDGRYELQAAQEAPSAIYAIVKLKDLNEWAKEALPEGGTIGLDPWLMTPDAWDAWEKRAKAAGARLRAIANPIDALWNDRPPPPTAPARVHPEALAGESAGDKRARIAKSLTEEKLDAAVLTQPDAIAWLLNIRGADIPNTPVTLAFATIDAAAEVELFSDPAKFAPDLRAALEPSVRISPWEAFEGALRRFRGKRVAVEKASAPRAVGRLLEDAEAELVWRRDPTSLPKARKNAAEIKGARAAQRRDGAALVETLRWIDEAAPSGALTELMVAEELTRQRKAVAARLGSECVDESFSPIVGFGPNGAVVHYRVSAESSLPIAGDGILLLDSGGQYPDGTTDVTRTIAIGQPTGEMRAVATRVLQGMISVSRLVFPKKTHGRDLEAFARRALWASGLDFDHGVGHGVGSFLSVHEGPQGLSKRGTTALEPGMILSNEPGCYLAGRFGVRIENLILVSPAEEVSGVAPITPFRQMHRFETLTLAPIDRRLIEPGLLSSEERAWLDAYHARVLQEISPLLESAESRAWLEQACAPL